MENRRLLDPEDAARIRNYAAPERLTHRGQQHTPACCVADSSATAYLSREHESVLPSVWSVLLCVFLYNDDALRLNVMDCRFSCFV